MFVAAPVFAVSDPGSEQVYVAAEVYAREGKTSLARHELGAAQNLEPALPFARPDAVAALRTELARGVTSMPVIRDRQPRGSAPLAIPWGTLALVLAAAAALWFFLRKRSQPNPDYYFHIPGTASFPAAAPAGMANISGTPAGGGIGSGIAGGLASGLAVGAGVVAGEELARHFLGSGRSEGTVMPPSAEPVDWT